MPDPAIEATRLGLPYTEPTSKSMFSRRRPTAQVKWETNPNDPTAPPRKVIEVNDDSKGGGWWSRTLGGKAAQWENPPNVQAARKQAQSPHSAAMFGTANSHSAAQSLQPETTVAAPTPAEHPPVYTVEALPENFWSLSWSERRQLEKMRNNQIKALRDWSRAEEARIKVQKKANDKVQMAELKTKRKELKEQEKQLKRNKRRMPKASPPTQGEAKKPDPKAAAMKDPITRWMLLPSGEEFGVRRPFNASGWPPPAGSGDWPMMSRTMTQALHDMSLEERVHAVQAGRVVGAGWF